MRATRLALAVSGLILASAATVAATAQTTAPAPAPAAADIVAGRQAAFLLSAANFGAMKAAVDRGDDVKSQAFAARSLARWAKALPGMFPTGTDIAPSEALPSVWSDRAGFAARAADYAAAAEKLAQLAQAGDAAGFAAQRAEVGKTCGSCHESYRKKEEKRPG